MCLGDHCLRRPFGRLVIKDKGLLKNIVVGLPKNVFKLSDRNDKRLMEVANAPYKGAASDVAHAAVGSFLAAQLTRRHFIQVI